MKYAYTLFLKFLVRYINPNYFCYSFKCVRRVCPNLSSAPSISQPMIVLQRAVVWQVACEPHLRVGRGNHGGGGEDAL
jgi:hypothetical protein